MISIVIITLNEEKRLPRLLDSLSTQTFKDFEIILVDAQSKDKTVSIAKKYQKKLPLTIITNSEKNISSSRNKGATKAKGEYIFFMDSDIFFGKDFLKKSVHLLKQKNLDVSAVYLKAHSDHLIDKFYYSFTNFWFYLLQVPFPQVFGSCMISKPEVHKKIKGFDTTIKLAEDCDYVRRAGKEFTFRMIPVFAYASVRRFVKEGRLLTLKFALVFFHRLLLGEIRSDIFKYRFDEYEKPKS